MHPSYKCDFGDGVTATASINLESLKSARGKVEFYTVEFTGQPHPNMIPQYRDWMLMIHRDAADFINDKILFVFQPAVGVCQMWACAPNSDPVMVPPDKVLSPRKQGKPGCKRCGGRGYIGRDLKAKKLINCSCLSNSIDDLPPR